MNTQGIGKKDNDTKKLRVAAYCRVSTSSDEQLTSYYAQVKYFEKYIKSNPDYEYAGIYADEGISGTDLKKRDAFNKLMQDARDGKIDLIIAKSLSRFGRNTIDNLKSIRELREIGVDVFFEKENLHTKTSEGELLLTLISAVAQNESLSLSENVKWGIHRKYEKGCIQSIPSGKFYGYDKDKSGLVINEDQAATVRRMYQEFLDGYGYYQIMQHINEDKILTDTGIKNWNWSTIKNILTNEKYKGDTRFQKTYNADYLTKHRVKNNGELPSYYLENTHPAIIDKNIWECVQLEFERQSKFIKEHNMNKYHHHCERLPFIGKLICNECGHILVRREGKRLQDKGKFYWCCNVNRLGRCRPANPCSNEVKIKDAAPEQIFIKAWNQLVDNHEWKQDTSERNVLEQYRMSELIRIAREIGIIDKMPYTLMLKTLEYIKICKDGTAEVIFLAGLKVNIGYDF